MSDMIERYTLPENITEHNHIRIIYNHPTWTTPIHMHRYFEMELVLSGCCKQMLNGKVYNISRGSLYFLSPVDFHRLFDFEEKLEAINISFDNYFLGSDIVQIFMNRVNDIVLQLDDGEIEKAESIIKLLKESGKIEDKYTERNIKNLLECFLIYILRKAEGNSNESFSTELTQIQKGIRYLFLHYKDNPTVDEISKICGYSPSHFCRQFKSITGATYIGFLNSLKINNAKILLLTSQTPIIEIAELCGFNSVSNFNRVFREQVGISPSEFVKKNKIDDKYSSVK